VQAINGGANDGVYWLVGSFATLGTDTVFAGNILAQASITLTTGADIVCGRALAQTGAVTMDTNLISNNCNDGGDYSTTTGLTRSDFSSAGFSGNGINSGAAAVPEPATFLLFGSGLLALAALLSRSDSRKRRVPALVVPNIPNSPVEYPQFT
jgi:hypothetical protein